jgi:hypothetical protein
MLLQRGGVGVRTVNAADATAAPLRVEIEKLKQERKNATHHIPVKFLPQEDRFTRLRTERKHFIDTIKMIAYRAESSLALLLRERIARTVCVALSSANSCSIA